MSKYSSQRRYCERSVTRLKGILAALASDRSLSDQEIAGLYQWMQENDVLAQTPPFDELFTILNDSLEDQVIDADERKEILDWCTDYCSQNSTMHCVETEAIRLLHGYLHGLLIDEKLTDAEIYNLRDWLASFTPFRPIWPFSEAFELVEDILADGRIDADERRRLYEFCDGFVEKPLDEKNSRIHDPIYNTDFMKSQAPVLKPLESICDTDICIEFDNRTFCLTGPAKSGKRADIHDAIRRAGGSR